MLLSMSRNLRRASLKNNIAGIETERISPVATVNGHSKDDSVLYEEGEELDEGNVRKLTQEFDARSSGSHSVTGSECGDLEDVRSLGGDLVAERAMRFEKGETEDVGARFGRVVETPSGEETFRDGILGFVGESIEHEERGTFGSDGEAVPELTSDTLGLGISSAAEEERLRSPTEETFITPPPAYITSFASGLPHPSAIQEEGSTPTGSALPPLPVEESTAWLGEPAHMSNMIQHHKSGARPYGVLRRNSSGSSAGGPRLPTLKSLRASRGEENELEEDFRDTGRKATLRPIRKVTEIFRAESGSVTPQPQSQLDKLEKLLQELEAAKKRIDELEKQQKRWVWLERFGDPAMIMGGLAVIGAVSVLALAFRLARRNR